MDPNVSCPKRTGIERLKGVARLVILAFILKRALAPVFEHRLFPESLDKQDIKPPIAFVSALVVCWHRAFDARPTLTQQWSRL